MRKIIKMFEKGNVCVCGLKGSGKDMLMANVVVRRRLPFVSNVDYCDARIPFVPSDFNCAKNTYKNFISGDVNYYEYPFPDGTDVYISDAGVYFPSQYCNELNRDFGYFATFMALSRHLGDCSVHTNVQNFSRCWDKIREQSDQYIMCKWCKVIFGITIQRVVIYEIADSAQKRVPPFRVPRPWVNKDRLQTWRLAKQHYEITYGSITPRLLIYRHRSNYNTRIFQEVLANGKK